MVIGVLALQGDFSKHIEKLQQLKSEFLEVRYPVELDFCDALIIPGGESTTLIRHLEFIQLKQKILEFSHSKPIFGTCAGLILMAKEVKGSKQFSFGLLDITVERNAFGRQKESFVTEIALENQKQKTVPGVFIRAPRIVEFRPEVKVLATFKGEPVLVRQGRHLGCSFHPELTEDNWVHKYFLDIVSKG